MEIESNGQEVIVVLFGRTGSGKSSLGNQIAGTKIFEEGHELHSFTSSTLSEIIFLKQIPQIKIKIIDTPGLADNREGMTTAKLLSDILVFLKELKNGFNVGIYCLPVKPRLDAHDINEIELLSLILGQEVFKHTIIAVTQINTFEKSTRKAVYENYPTQLCKILAEHNLKGFGPNRVLFSDFDNFDKGFMDDFVHLLKTTPSYIPQIAEDLNPEDPQSIQRFLATPEIQAVTKKYESMLGEQKKEIEKMHSMIESQKIQNDEMTAKALEEQEIHRNRIKNLDKEIQSLGKEKNELKRDFKAYRDQEQQKLNKLTQEVEEREERNKQYQRKLLEQENKFQTLSNQINELEKTRHAAQNHHQEKASGSFWEKLVQDVMKTATHFVLKKVFVNEKKQII